MTRRSFSNKGKSMEAIRVLTWAEFKASPGRLHRFFSDVSGCIQFDRQLVSDLSDLTPDKELRVQVQKNETVILVQSTLEMAEVIQELMTKLLLMRITVIHTEVASKYSVEKVSILEDDFAVLINTSHPSLRKELSRGLQEAAVDAAKNRRFCLEIDLTETMQSWYTENRDAFTSCDDIHSMKMRRTRLYVTNHTIFNHNLDCSPKWIIFLGLCWLVSAPSYYIYRMLTCHDIRVAINGEITLMTNMLPESSECSRSLNCGSQKYYHTV